MSHPNPSHERGNEYPEDKVSHYKSKSKKAFDTHGKVMGVMLDAMRGSKSKALKKKLK